MKKSFIIYSDFKATLDKLPNEDAGKLFKMIVDFSNGIETEPESLILDVVFTPIRQQMIRDIDKYENEIKKRKQAGSLGGKAKAKTLASARSAKQVLASAKQSLANVADNVNVTVNDTVTDTDNVKSNFKKWSIDDFKNEITINRKTYPDLTLKKFFNYWSEKDAKGKMRFQLQKTWETSKRLSNWATNNISKNNQELPTRSSGNKITIND